VTDVSDQPPDSHRSGGKPAQTIRETSFRCQPRPYPLRRRSRPGAMVCGERHRENRQLRYRHDPLSPRYGPATRSGRRSASTVGADGELWLRQKAASKIGRITLKGEITESHANSRARDHDGIDSWPGWQCLVLRELKSADRRITPQGQITSFATASRRAARTLSIAGARRALGQRGVRQRRRKHHGRRVVTEFLSRVTTASRAHGHASRRIDIGLWERAPMRSAASTRCAIKEVVIRPETHSRPASLSAAMAILGQRGNFANQDQDAWRPRHADRRIRHPTPKSARAALPPLSEAA